MAISVNGGGNGGGRRRFHGTAAISEINVTPFVDVVLVLLIIFMMTAHAMEYGIEIDVPKTGGVEKSALDLPIVQITHDGRFFLNEQPVDNIHNLAAAIKRRFPESEGRIPEGRQGHHLGRGRAGDERTGRGQTAGQRGHAAGRLSREEAALDVAVPGNTRPAGVAGKALAGFLVFHGGVVALLAVLRIRVSQAQRLGQPESRRRSRGGERGEEHSAAVASRAGESAGERQQTTVPLPPPQGEARAESEGAGRADAVPIPARRRTRRSGARLCQDHLSRARPGRVEPDFQRYRSGPEIAADRTDGTGGDRRRQGSTLGNRFGWYIDLLRTKVGQHWNPDQQSAAPTIVTFTLMKDGSARDIKIAQRSGNSLRIMRRNAPFSTPRHFLRCPTERAIPPISNLSSTRGDDEEEQPSLGLGLWSPAGV